MSETTDHILLRRDFTAPIPPAQWPTGVTRVRLVAANARAVHEALQTAYRNGYGSVEDDWLEWWELVVSDTEFSRDLTFVAKADGEVVGLCLCWTSSFVKDLVVVPRWQGRGVGTALLSEAMAALRDRGASEVRLKVVSANAGARRLYERCGFSE